MKEESNNLFLNVPKIRKKHRAAAVAFVLIFSMVATSFAFLPGASGAILFTQACVSVNYKVSGLNQQILITGWINPPPLVNAGVYSNYTFTITKPDGSRDIVFRDYSNRDATWSFNYVCTQIGNWSVTLYWPGDAKHNAITSQAFTWTVQKDMVPNNNLPVPVPAGAWDWPINGQYYDWYQISGAWPNAWMDAAGTNFNPFTKAPNTPHVLWTYRMTDSGLIGGVDGAYSAQVDSPIMVSGRGRIYYRYGSGLGSALHPVVVCIDQLTGKEIWRKDMPCNTSNPSAGGAMALDVTGRTKNYVEIVTDINQPTGFVQVVAHDNLWMVGNGIWQINPFSGECTYYLSGTMQSSTGKGGGLLIDDSGNLYLTNYPGSNVTKWSGETHSINWTIPSPTLNGTYSQSTSGTSGFGQPWLYGDMWFGNNRPTGGDPYGIALSAINTTSGKIQYLEAVAGNGIYPSTGYQGGFGYGHVIMHAIDRYWYCQDVATGQTVWKSDVQSDFPWGSFGMYQSASGYGMYYQGQYDGHMYALNETNGHLVWKSPTDVNLDIVSGVNIPWGRMMVADGKIYFMTGEHDIPNPNPRGATLYCMNALTGELIWKIKGFQDRGSSGGQSGGVSSGVLYTYNMYDGQVWAFSPGPTSTTVSANPKVVAKGAGVLIEGTVMDQSPASPNTPAVSDDSMGVWEDYLTLQSQNFPANATGVTVHLQAQLENGTVIDVTHVKTDLMGHYEYTWHPQTEGTIKIIATFDPTDSYYGSAEQTGVSVEPATSVVPIVTPTPTLFPTASPIVTPTIAPTPTPTTPTGPGGIPASTMYAIAAAVIIIAIVVVAAVALRRRK